MLYIIGDYCTILQDLSIDIYIIYVLHSYIKKKIVIKHENFIQNLLIFFNIFLSNLIQNKSNMQENTKKN